MDKEIIEARRKFGRRLLQLRKKSDWTQKDLAEKCQIHVRHIQRLESVVKPSAVEIDSIIKIAKAFKITPSKLLDF